MIADTEVLARLSKILSPGEIPATVGRLMRSPLAWEYLHRPAVLAATDQVSPDNLAPSRLAFLAINQKPETLQPGSLAQKGKETDWSDVLPEQRSPKTIEEAASFASHILQAADRTGWENEVANVVLNNPAFWQEPLLFAWPYLPAGNELFSLLSLSEEQEALQLLCSCLIANEGLIGAARRFVSLPIEDLNRIAVRLQNRGETELVAAITAELSQEAGTSSASLEHRITGLAVNQAAKKLLTVDSANPDMDLENSFENLSSLQAILADELAEAAWKEQDYKKEASRRKQALQTEPSHLRRALLAQAYNNLGQYEEALAVLPDACESIEECIAAGISQRELGEIERAKVLLSQAADGIQDIEGNLAYWVAVLLDTLDKTSGQQASLEVARTYTSMNPGNPEAHSILAAQLYASGDYRSAVETAQIGLSMAPGSLPGRKILALALQAIGKHAQALPHWEKLTDVEPLERANMAQCALEAGSAELAQSTAALMLEENPEDLLAETIHCQALSRLGKTDEAAQRMNSLLTEYPHEPALWLAYINTLKDTAADGEIETAFARANQAVLDDPELLTAYADWLYTKNRYSEALGFAERAFRLNQRSARTAMLYASLLQKMADPKASIVLQKAHELQPRNWELVLNLALLTEAEGSAVQAASLLAELPLHLEPEQNLSAGRIFFLASQHNGNMLEKAVLHLQQAVRKEGLDQAVFWLAESLAAAGRGAEARQQYQAFLASASASTDREMQKMAFLNLASTAAEEENLILSLTTLESAMEALPGDTDVMLPLAQAYLQAGMFQQCMDTASQILSLRKDHEAAQSLLLQAAIASGSEARAEEILQMMLEKYPQSASTWLNAASLRLAQDRLQDVRDSAAAALYYGRHSASTLIKAGELLLKAGLNENAVRVLRYGINTLPLENGLLRQLAEASEGSNDFQGAQKAWRKYTQQAPQDPEGFLRAGEALWKLDRRAAATELLNQAASRFTECAAFPLQLAAYQLTEGDHIDSRQSYRKAVALSPDDPAVLTKAADGLIRLDELSDAKILLDKALSLAPSTHEIQLLLAKCLLLQNKSSEAFNIISTMEWNTPLPAGSLSIAALAAAKEKSYDQALDLFARAHAQPVTTEDDVLWLSRAARALGYWDISIQVFAGIQEVQQNQTTAIQQEMQQAWLAAREADSVLRELCDIRTHAVKSASFNGITLPPTYPENVDQLSTETTFSDNLINLRFKLAMLHLTKETMEEISSVADPDLTPEFLTSLAVTQLRSNQPSKALDTLHKIHQQTQLDDWQSLLISIALVNHKQTSMARKTISSLRINPNLQPVLEYLEAASWLIEGEIESYCQSMTGAVTRWENEPLWQNALGQIYAGIEDTASALPHLQQAVILEPENTVFLRSLAQNLAQDGQLAEATEVYEQAIRTSPADSGIFVEAGQLALELEQPVKAARWFQRAGDLGASGEAYYLGRARTSAAQQDFVQAVELVHILLQDEPEHAEALLLLSEIHRSAGEPDLALQALEKAGNLIPETKYLAIERSRLKLETGKMDEALQELKQLIEEDPSDEELWALLSDAYQAIGQNNQAVEALTKAVRLAPRNPGYRIKLGTLCMETGQLDHALDELDTAAELNPANSQIQLARGKIFEQRKQFSLALQAYQEAISLDPDQAAPHFMAGMILKKLKAYQEAGFMLKQAASLNPKDPDIMHQLAAVRALELVHGQTFQPVVES
ncbi:MAG: tetratricopeptide repeat protein [Anaerolineales bacterium]|nr:tetratricopeptide repeat protein [Anaerolineales bacterium]